ncbi:uncharacterized protein LOC114351648 [Ostrinia furnacalis]|uniref:uncharacterized protein LOC114351648 n=1 Tax=Ostrinia furnacalis TaxID=93504 RepID=UPI00103AE2A0|nr:uncharacterized protein LOC114351648 [Ostrinia furnacalis]
MVFKRDWDSSCPRVWDRWEANGRTWVVQDLRPEDDEKALRMLVDVLVPDEALCAACDLYNDPVSIASIEEVWRKTIAERMTLGCYTEVDGPMTLVALNACTVMEKGEHPELTIEGKAWKNVYAVIDYIEQKKDAFEVVGTDVLLHALGLVVSREFRGSRLGGRILAAREPLCKSVGIKGTATVFTGPASQKLAAKCGFTTIAQVTWAELADSGLDYPREEKIVKYMVKKYE